MIPLLDDRDKTIRDEAKLLLVEVYRWIGKQTLMPLIQNVKPIQVKLRRSDQQMIIFKFKCLDARITSGI